MTQWGGCAGFGMQWEDAGLITDRGDADGTPRSRSGDYVAKVIVGVRLFLRGL